jgi:hypothetical protein
MKACPYSFFVGQFLLPNEFCVDFKVKGSFDVAERIEEISNDY